MSLITNDARKRKLDDIRKDEEEDLVRILAEEKYGIPSIDLATIMIENDALRVIPEAVARKADVGPFKIVGKTIDIAVRAPDRAEVKALEADLRKNGYTPVWHMASQRSIEKCWDRYQEISFASTSRAGGLDISGETIKELANELHNVADVKRLVETTIAEGKPHTVSRILEIILSGAISINASDVHIEPEEDRVRLRYRLDGVLQDILFFDYKVHKLLNSRLKLIAGLKLSTAAVAQDGRFSIFIGDDEISMRVSVIPGEYGEGIVMRILNPKSIRVKLEDMGIEKRVYDIMMHAISRPNGLVLITGPTGSGKTTTLYAFLNKIYSADIKIMTIEDPVEYHLAGVTQTQTDSEKGYTFANGLRAALRQDPDVIMVGEIRDGETATTAIEASNTGHLVFSTLHTNSAAGVIPRLIDLGVNPKILVSALRLSMAQRLCRKLCTVCRTEDTDTKDKIDLMRKIITEAARDGKDLAPYKITPDMEIKLYKPVGCDKCNNTGYKGRIGVYEAIKTDEALEKIMPGIPSEREIRAVARKQGTFDMREDGVVKMIQGITSFEEVASVVDLYEE